MKKFFTLEYWTDDGWYVGRLKDVPGVFSQGESLEVLEEHIKDDYRMMGEEDQAGGEVSLTPALSHQGKEKLEEWSYA